MMDDQQALLRETAVLRLGINGREVDFRYPDSAFMRDLVALIFTGAEYPLVNLPGYSPAIIVDVGGNIGATAAYFHGAYPTAQIFCYEPSAENFRCLHANAKTISSLIQPYHYGLLDQDCELPLYRGLSQTAESSLVQGSNTPVSTETVRLVDVAKEVAARGWPTISILKMDTEGCEVPIFRGFLAAVAEIDLVYCEYHSEEDRRTIDTLAADRFLLSWSKADNVHQGTSVYMARALADRYPEIAARSKSFVR